MAFPATPINGQLYTTGDGRRYTYSLVADSWSFIGNNTLIKNNLTAPRAPVSTDDAGSGYVTGSLWIDTAGAKPYYCVSSTVNAAIWIMSGGATVSLVLPLSPTIGQIALETTNSITYIWNGTAWVDITAAGTGIKNNFSATTSPTVTDSTANGYAVGSEWIDILLNLKFTCVDSSTGAAIWIQGGGSAATVAAIAPTTPASGDIWFDTSNSITYLWDGTAWIDVTAAAGGAGGSAATVAATAPLTPVSGDIWFDTTNSTTYLWDGTAWIDVTAAAGGTQPLNNYAAIIAPTTANDSTQSYSIGSEWVDTVTNFSYKCVDSSIGAAIWNRTS